MALSRQDALDGQRGDAALEPAGLDPADKPETGDEAEAAIAACRLALEKGLDCRRARRQLAILLLEHGPRDECAALLQAELQAGGLGWFTDVVVAALNEGQLARAAKYYALLAALRWGSKWYPPDKSRPVSFLPESIPNTSLTIPKLAHDIEQFLYLQRRGAIGAEFTPIIAQYRGLMERMTPLGVDARLPMDDEIRRSIGHVYNRIVHVREAPRLRRALSDSWNGARVESQYIDQAPGLVVVDEFLSSEALDSLRLFCLESTIWSSNRHPHGRLGAQFQNGFNCPLLIQIAEELRERLPRLIGAQYPLRHMWGYKSPPILPPDVTTHADFAALNINFWITPDEANLDSASGGMVVYGVDAPLHWDFDTYNSHLEDIIKPYLQRQQARAVTIPYRQNRAIIFNSDLFHGTCALKFRPEYEHQRVNVTLLYGDRQEDVHHVGLARPEPSGTSDRQPAWRSAAFSGARRQRL